MRLLISFLALFLAASAQIEPEASSVVLYFPQLADGGSVTGERWQTTLTFMHASLFINEPAEVLVEFYDDDGRPLALDFGGGASSSLRFTVPRNGLRRFTSRMSSSRVVTGWARAAATVPVQGTVAFRQFLGGRPTVELTAHGTVPSHSYVAVANPDLGIALANPYSSSSLTLELSLRNSDGSDVGQRSVTLPPLGHRSFNLRSLFGDLAPGFTGAVLVSHATEPVPFVGWAVQAQGGLMSTLPSGRYVWPPEHSQRILNVFVRIRNASVQLDRASFEPPIRLELGTERKINAYAYRTGDRIQINLATSELFGDAEAELAWVIAHEIGHIYQFRSGRHLFSTNSELDADAWAALLLLVAGYDPYAAAGALGRLQLAAGAPGLLGEFVRDLLDPHGAFSTRIDMVFQTLYAACNLNQEMQNMCATYRKLIHPHFPTDLPLGVRPPSKSGGASR